MCTIILFLITLSSLQAMEVEQQNMWVSAKLLHAFLPASEFKKLGKQVFDGGKDDKWGTIDLNTVLLIYAMCQTLPEDLSKYICDFCYCYKSDQDLIKQAYVNSYTLHAKFPRNTWEEISSGHTRYKIPYSIPEKSIEIRFNYYIRGDGFYPQIVQNNNNMPFDDNSHKNFTNSALQPTMHDRLHYNNGRNEITFTDIITKQEYIKQPWEYSPLTTSCFDSDIGIIGIDNKNVVKIFKPYLNYEKMKTFIKTMTPYDRMLVHAVLKTSK